MKGRFNSLLKGSKGQSMMEYALVAGIIAAAAIAMSTYVFRSVQATQQTIYQEHQDSR